MKLDAKTISILSNFSSILPSIVVKPGNVLRTVSKSKTVFAEAQLDVTFEKGFGISDLGRFLSMLSLFSEPEMEVTDSAIVLTEGTNKITYARADTNFLLQPKDNTVDFGSCYVSFDLPAEVLAKVKKAASILKLGHMVVYSKDGKIVVGAFDNAGRIADSFEQVIGETDRDFQLIYNLDYLLVLPLQYHVEVFTLPKIGNPPKDMKIAHFTSRGDTKVKYIIAMEDKSRF